MSKIKPRFSKSSAVTGIHQYDAPAGGWGALKATAKAVRDQMDLAEAPGLLLRTNKPDGFDCPGCAWPDKHHSSTFQFCENGAKAVTWEATKKRVPPEFFSKHTVAELLSWSDYKLEDEGRITHPMAYDALTDTYKPISWDDAFARIAAAMRALPHPDMAEFYTSGRASNEAAFLFQLFARAFGTNNFPDCSNMCHEATSQGLPKSIGLGKGTVSLEDFDQCELIIAMGHNPGTNHPRMMGTLHECARRGVPIIVFNPMKERALERFADPQSPIEMATFGSADIASAYHQVRVGGDAAALKGIIKAVLEIEDTDGDALDQDFLRQHTIGLDSLRAQLATTEWDALERASGLTRQALRSVAQAYVKSNATIVTYGMGITQHAHGTQNVQQIANLLLLRGNFGKPGAGICPLRGHSNVQGDRTVGINEKPPQSFLDGIQRAFGFTPPSGHGHDAVAALQAMVDGRSKLLICLGGNLPIAMPDPVACAEGMRQLELAVHLTTKLNRSHLLIGKDSIILPVLGRTEQDIQASGPQSITVEDSMSMVHASRGKLPPASPHLRSEPAIIAGVAAAVLGDRYSIDWAGMAGDYDRIRDKIEETLPDFESYNARIRIPGGFRLPLPPTERKWNTPSGKAEFLLSPTLSEDEAAGSPDTPPGRGVLTLTTIRSHDQYNTTIYGMDDRYRGVFGRRDVVFLHRDDLAGLGLAHGDAVEVETVMPGRALRRLRLTAVAHDIARGSAAAYYPEANGLVPLDYSDATSGTPAYKSIPVRISRAA